jgi:hypothetical protein
VQRTEDFFSGPIAQWLHWEQSLHNRDAYSGSHRSALSISGLHEKYHPESRQAWHLPYLKIPLDSPHHSLTLDSDIQDSIVDSLLGSEGSKRFLRFFLHPASALAVLRCLPKELEYIAQEDSEFVATPTSSLRSLVVARAGKASRPFILKLSVMAYTYGFLRNITAERAEKEQRNAKMLKRLGILGSRSSGINLLRDVGAMTLRLEQPLEMEDPTESQNLRESVTSLGAIIRELPEEHLNGEMLLMACTSYMSTIRQPETWTETIARTNAKKPLDSLRDCLINPGLHTLGLGLSKYGLIFEPHSQNVLLQFGPGFEETASIWLRDLASVWVDPIHCFFRSPGVYRCYLKSNNGQHMSYKEYSEAIACAVKSFGYHFLFGNVFRALRILALRNCITNEEAGEAADHAHRQAVGILARHFEIELANIATNAAMSACITRLVHTELNRFRAKLQPLESDEIAANHLPSRISDSPSILSTGVQIKDGIESDTLSWFRGPGGFAASAGDDLVLLIFT